MYQPGSMFVSWRNQAKTAQNLMMRFFLDTLYNQCQNPMLTQLNPTQRNSKGLALRLYTVATRNPPKHHTNFSDTSRPARELKFGTNTN